MNTRNPVSKAKHTKLHKLGAIFILNLATCHLEMKGPHLACGDYPHTCFTSVHKASRNPGHSGCEASNRGYVSILKSHIDSAGYHFIQPDQYFWNFFITIGTQTFRLVFRQLSLHMRSSRAGGRPVSSASAFPALGGGPFCCCLSFVQY